MQNMPHHIIKTKNKPTISTKLRTSLSYNKLINAKTNTFINNKQNIITYFYNINEG